MENRIRDIYTNKAGSLIAKLVGFLGESNVRECLKRYEHAMKSSGVIFREYYLKDRHPWLNALRQYYELTSHAKCVHRHPTPELRILAGDAKKVTALQNQMPDSVRNKYKKDLLDQDRARSYLFEIQIAWHFFVRNWDIQWYEDDSSKHPEFVVKAPELHFDVECKFISIDIARKIHRREFYTLADQLIPQIEKRKCAGRLDIRLKDRLDSATVGALCTEVLKKIDSGFLQGDCDITPIGSLAFDLKATSGILVDATEWTKRVCERKPDEAHCAVFGRAEGTRVRDPLELTVMSEKADAVLDAMKEKISKAETQFDGSRPGLIVCFLEGINGFELHELGSESGLQRMTNYVLDKDIFSYVMGISYSSESMVKKRHKFEEVFNPGLFFRNHKCKFEAGKTFDFLSPLKS